MLIRITCPSCKIEEEREWDGKTSTLYTLRACPNCKTDRDFVFENEEKSLKSELSSIHFSRLSSMTPQERKELLKKRSNNDYKKNVEAKKRWMDKQL